ncbi:hypothetical protein XPR_3164 [Xanthomonas arboricola pv. pruni MAFF 301420]|uniref:Uncharacterized protein n=2 Tax=Xanthomonas arboricola pv. pruni TaxID=69929 RepID=W4SKP4_9XANT|nr:hypothetical protein XPU_3649 [Xanthomonas arboricola pv. pruni str. MAFF 311562]GAE56529.1 hypothetical protein XPR_3164 [Xanthomonas arboricola pv. pruni MAFF 301420]GAE58362.1 hypothetical protein XPN_0268 [Xanthomonas arboricola pv. pruni MAFF 301427]GAE61249.1 hypothetical protein XPN_3155 [Xanthomonas arboricola pv. pruni MAFF 301427]
MRLSSIGRGATHLALGARCAAEASSAMGAAGIGIGIGIADGDGAGGGLGTDGGCMAWAGAGAARLPSICAGVEAVGGDGCAVAGSTVARELSLFGSVGSCEQALSSKASARRL